MEKKYLQYSATELATDEAFVNWILHPEERQAAAWTSWIEKYPEVVGKVEEAKKIVLNVQFVKKRVGTDQKQQLWDRISESLKRETTIPTSKKISRKQVLYILSTAAAACILIFLVIRWGNFSSTRIISQSAQQFSHTLPDQSTVKLNAASTLKYNQKKWGLTRSLRLKGEAFFMVQKGPEFIVTTDWGNVKVLGTSFNIYSREYFQVKCFTGKVQVLVNDQTQVLIPGEMTDLIEGKLIKNNFSVDQPNSWRDGIFTFDESELGTVFEELERQFNVIIKTEKDIDRRIYNGFFENKNLDDALYQICWPMKLNSQRNGNTITITEQ